MTAGGVHGKRVDPERQRRHGDSGSSAEEKEDGREKTRENIDCPCESRGEFYISFRNSGMIYKLTINN